jgi:hypothetical protein
MQIKAYTAGKMSMQLDLERAGWELDDLSKLQAGDMEFYDDGPLGWRFLVMTLVLQFSLPMVR